MTKRGAPKKPARLKSKPVSIRLPVWFLERLALSPDSQSKQIVNAFAVAYGWEIDTLPASPSADNHDIFDEKE